MHTSPKVTCLPRMAGDHYEDDFHDEPLEVVEEMGGDAEDGTLRLARQQAEARCVTSPRMMNPWTTVAADEPMVAALCAGRVRTRTRTRGDSRSSRALTSCRSQARTTHCLATGSTRCLATGSSCPPAAWPLPLLRCRLCSRACHWQGQRAPPPEPPVDTPRRPAQEAIGSAATNLGAVRHAALRERCSQLLGDLFPPVYQYLRGARGAPSLHGTPHGTPTLGVQQVGLLHS